MDHTNRFDAIDPTYRLLALCARAVGHSIVYKRLSHLVERFDAWHELPSQAELHGMASLLWHHLQIASVPLPPKARQTLIGLYLRHRLRNQAHLTALKEINTQFERAGIRAILLKGLALAHQYYPDPALRPVSDIDLLLKQEDVLPALDLLTKAGFQLNPSHASRTSQPLPAEVKLDSPVRAGVRVEVELHSGGDEEFKGLETDPQSLAMIGNAICVPDTLNTLRYLSRHFRRHLFAATPSRPAQLKWVADMVSLVEQNAETLDWFSLSHSDPILIAQLETFYSLTPLPDRLKGVIPIRQISPPKGVNQYPCGWPQQHFSSWKRVGLFRFLRRTFSSPSEWWLRLYFGGGATGIWRGRTLYLMRIVRRIVRTLLQRH